MQFTYTARGANGEMIEGVIEAVDRFALAHDLRGKGNVPLAITEKKQNFLELSALLKIFERVKVSELILFTRNLSGMIRAGLSLSRAISVLLKQTKNPALAKILKSLESDIAGGATLSAGLAKFPKVFSSLFVSMVRSGEESGNLAGSLSEVGISLEKSHSLTKKVRGAMVYPGVILSAMVVIGVLMFAFVVPTLASTFKELGVTLPLSTRILIAMGNFFSAHLILTFLILKGGYEGYRVLSAGAFRSSVHRLACPATADCR